MKKEASASFLFVWIDQEGSDSHDYQQLRRRIGAHYHDA
jgi:hypothetical protein